MSLHASSERTFSRTNPLYIAASTRISTTTTAATIIQTIIRVAPYVMLLVYIICFGDASAKLHYPFYTNRKSIYSQRLLCYNSIMKNFEISGKNATRAAILLLGTSMLTGCGEK